MTTPTWENWETASALHKAAKLAKELDNLLNVTFSRAAIADRARMEGTALYAIEVLEITEAASKLADALQAEADATVETA